MNKTITILDIIHDRVVYSKEDVSQTVSSSRNVGYEIKWIDNVRNCDNKLQIER
jgi:hypothetical protein